MQENKKFIYIPSFSAGVYGNQIKKDFNFRNGKEIRIYHKNIDKSLYNPWFLAPAGHLYKNFEYRNQIKTDEDTILFGDSGGFQIASGAIKWDPSLREKIFKWLESQCDYSVNLDIPPRLNYNNKFDECLEISSENFKYFSENQSGKTKFLNVMQGDTVERYSKWCRSVKHFDFNGWCLGGVGVNLTNLLSAIAVFLDEVNLFDKNVDLVHSLGTSKVIDFAILSQFQKSLNDIGSHIQVTTDSSSPNNASRFGTYYLNGNLKDGSFKQIHVPKTKLGGDYNMIPGIAGLPKTATCDDWLEDCYTWEDIDEYTNEFNCVMVLHGFGVFMDTKRLIDELISGHPYFVEQILHKDIVRIIGIVNDMVVSTQNGGKAVDVYAKNKMTINQIASNFSETVIDASPNEFF